MYLRVWQGRLPGENTRARQVGGARTGSFGSLFRSAGEARPGYF